MIKANSKDARAAFFRGGRIMAAYFRGSKIWEHTHAWSYVDGNGGQSTCATCGQTCTSHQYSSGTGICAVCGKQALFSGNLNVVIFSRPAYSGLYMPGGAYQWSKTDDGTVQLKKQTRYYQITASYTQSNGAIAETTIAQSNEFSGNLQPWECTWNGVVITRELASD